MGKLLVSGLGNSILACSECMALFMDAWAETHVGNECRICQLFAERA